MELLSAVLGFAVFIMACAQLKLVAANETSVESSDNGKLFPNSCIFQISQHVLIHSSFAFAEWYRKVAKSQNKEFKNPYNLGWKDNLRDFFNVGKGPNR